ncbi:S41 family peptidase [Psychroserpens mesophilus]|uniref:S41 family peptidase n=1 Tax=Psychroserpens mesophilus TaxID=325473 RepID=UPI003D657589
MNTFIKVISIYFIALLLSINGLFAQTSNKINWKEDLKIYKASLEQKHIDLYHSVTKEEFVYEWNKIYNNVDSLNDFEIILELMRLTRRVNDGHTAVSLRNMATHRFPFEIEYIDKEWRVVKVIKEHKSLLKLSLMAIDDVPIEEVSMKVSQVTQFVENEYSETLRTSSYLTISELLYNLDITKNRNTAQFTFLNENSKEIKVTLKALDKTAIDKGNFTELNIGIPEIIKPDKPMFDYLWYTSIKNIKAIYINFESYPSFEDMQVFGEQLVSYIQENLMKQVIIDMRNNGGGDLYVGTVLAYALNLADSIDWKNGVFVLTSNKTFSAATSNAALFKQLLNAKIVGQPTGSNPTGYQDMDSFKLPNSKLVITYSKRLFRLSEQENTALQPDVIINQKQNELFNSVDTVLKVLNNKMTEAP